MNPEILVVEDEADLRESVAMILARSGFRSRMAADAEEARFLIREAMPDLVLLDWMLPGISGMDLLRLLRKNSETKALPVILLTARFGEEDRVWGLESGADDYIIKPFSNRELVARIRAVLRRKGHAVEGGTLLKVANLELDMESHIVSADGQTIPLGPVEFRILCVFMERHNRVLTRDQILDLAWGKRVVVGERTVDVHIRHLRKALAPSGCDRLIHTVRGVGYRLSATPATV